MNIILTMAGKYSRFKLFANQVPKYLMPIGKSTVLWHVINELREASGSAQFFLIANKEDRDFFPVIKSITYDLEISTDNIIYIDDTKSQLETALAIFDSSVVEKIDNARPIAFTNIDTILLSRENFFETLLKLGDSDGLVDSFVGASSAYSYVQTDETGEILTLSDGMRLSDDACSGLYGFGSTDFFVSQARQLLRNNNNANFTSLYQALVDGGHKSFVVRNPESNRTIVLGTPEEYISNIHRFK